MKPRGPLGPEPRADVEHELSFHLEARARELIAAGFSPADARREARRRLGDARWSVSECRRIDRRVEQRRQMRRYQTDLRDDVWFAVRQFRRHPKCWAVIGLTLVVGLAASTSLFAVVDGVLLKPLPYPEAARLVRLKTWSLRGEFVTLRERATTMEVAAYYPVPRAVTVGVDGQPARLSAAGVPANLSSVLGVTPVAGRMSTDEEMRVGAPGIVGGSTSMDVRHGGLVADPRRPCRMSPPGARCGSIR